MPEKLKLGGAPVAVKLNGVLASGVFVLGADMAPNENTAGF